MPVTLDARGAPRLVLPGRARRAAARRDAGVAVAAALGARLRDPRRHRLRRGRRRVRRARTGPDGWINADFRHAYGRAPPARLGPLGRGVARRPARRRALRRQRRRAVRRRVDVPPRARRLEGRAAGPGRPARRRARRPPGARRAVADAAPGLARGRTPSAGGVPRVARGVPCASRCRRPSGWTTRGETRKGGRDHHATACVRASWRTPWPPASPPAPVSPSSTAALLVGAARVRLRRGGAGGGAPTRREREGVLPDAVQPARGPDAGGHVGPRAAQRREDGRGRQGLGQEDRGGRHARRTSPTTHARASRRSSSRPTRSTPPTSRSRSSRSSRPAARTLGRGEEAGRRLRDVPHRDLRQPARQPRDARDAEPSEACWTGRVGSPRRLRSGE